MEDSIRQKQYNKMIGQELDAIFRKKGWSMIGKGMLSIAKVKITTDLQEAKVFLSMFQIDDPEKVLADIEYKNWEVRKELGARIRNSVRRIPTLKFYIDDTLDYVDRIEEVLKRVRKDDDNEESLD